MYRFSFLLILIFFPALDADAQRRGTYESLLQRSDRPAAYVDDIYLPVNDSTAIFGSFFRLDYDFLPFLRKRPNVSPPAPELEYFAPVRMGLEIFEGSASSSGRNRSATSIFRSSYSDTVWVAEYDDTKSRQLHAQGLVQTRLNSGEYHYELQLTRGESVREVPSQKRNISIPVFTETDSGKISLVKNLEISGNSLEASILNYGNNVLYGQNYDVLILLPATSDNNLVFSINQLRVGSDSQATGQPVFEAPVTNENTVTTQGGSLRKDGEDVKLEMETGSGNFRYAYFSIPNQDFENARYKMQLRAEGVREPVAERIINSQWIDMPVSLYNLDVAIDMMKFIVNDQELRRLKSGSDSDKERKFREFWAQRDPTPDTEFNELMNEYYSRIDYSYQNFSSMQIPGYETDQGRAYILYGPPENIVRRFPTNSPTREIWEYNGRTLIFEATSGFGEFRLVSES